MTDPARMEELSAAIEVLRVERTHEGEAQRLAGQGEVFLDGAQLLFRRVGEALGECGQAAGVGSASGGIQDRSWQRVCRAQPCQSTPFGMEVSAATWRRIIPPTAIRATTSATRRPTRTRRGSARA